MADAFFQLDLATTAGDKVDAESLTVSGNTVKRERDQIAGSAAAEIAEVKNSAPTSGMYGLVTRNIPSGTQAISGALTDAELRATPVPVSAAALTSIDAKTPALVSGRQPVDGSGVTQPISAVALPLPSGASSAAGQATEIASLASIDSKTPALVSGRQPVDGSGVTQPISAVALPLPAGAAAEATLATMLTLAGFQARINTLGQKTAANSTPIVPASDVAGPSVGFVAHDAADTAGNVPTKIGAQARTTLPTAVADADVTNVIADKLGRQVAIANSPRELRTEGYITLTTTGETTLLAAGASGVFHDLHALVVNNTSGSSVRVDFRDATGGSVRFSLTVPGGETRGLALPCPISQATAANNWTAQLSGAVTDVRIFAAAHKVA